MDVKQELENFRDEMIQQIDKRISQILRQLEAENPTNCPNKSAKTKEYENIYRLDSNTSVYKGKKPTAVILPNGERIPCPTWKKVMEQILRDCCADEKRFHKLMDLRGKILGRNRVLLDSDSNKMRSPLKIDENLFVESHYDAESLLKILVNRILDPVGYDYTQVQIAVRAE